MASWAERRDAYKTQLREQQRRNALSQILSQAYDEQAGGLNTRNALSGLYRGGFGPEAMQYEQQLAERDAGIRKLREEYELKRQMQQELLNRIGGIGGGGLQPGQTLEIGPQGPKITLDPTKAAQLDLDRIKSQWETGVGGVPSGGPQGSPSAGAGLLPPKAQAEVTQGRLKALMENSASRMAAIENAMKFLGRFQSGKMESGAGRKALSYLPGVYSQQGQYDEEFNAFAETAARQALKASGEIRPTDADVKGMKEAMFGVGRDEKVNQVLLRNYIETAMKDENEYRAMTGQPPLPPLPSVSADQQNTPSTPTSGSAPQSAIEFLMKNDSPAMRQQFKAKYGYLPEGM